MKPLTNYQRATQYLNKVFKLINQDYFDNLLEMPTITIQSTVGAYGHVTTQKVWSNNETSSYELNMSADYLSRPIENVVTTLIHEACHLYAMQKGIKDTSARNNAYHNTKFKDIAEKSGLIVKKHNLYGWCITEPSEEIIEWCISWGLEDIEISRKSDVGWFIGGEKSGNGSTIKPPTNPPSKPSSTRKYQCPICGNSFRATKDINVLCMDCNVQFVKITPR